MKSYRIRVKENLLNGEIWLDVVESSEPHSFPNDNLQLKSTIILLTRKYLSNSIYLWRAIHNRDGTESWYAFSHPIASRVRFVKHSEQWVWWEKEEIFSCHLLYKKEGS